MRNALKRIAHGFLFGIGFSIALVVVAGLVVGLGGAFIVHKAKDAIFSQSDESKSAIPAEGVAVISTNVTQASGVLMVTAGITNESSRDYRNLSVAIEVRDPDGQSLDWRVEPLGTLSAYSHTNFNIVFEPPSSALITEQPSFSFEIVDMRPED